MANFDIPHDKKEFRCSHCEGKILIPRDLPPTTAPCPHCGKIITSPAAEAPAPPPAPAPIPAPAPMPPPAPAPIPPPPPASALPKARPAVVATEAPKQPAAAPAGVPPSAPDQAGVKLPTADARKTPVQIAPASQSARPHKSGLIPVMLVLLLLILGAGTAVHFVFKEMGRNVLPPTVMPSTGDVTARDANYIRIGWQKDAAEVLRNFMAATSSQEKLPHILNGGELATRLDDFYGGVVINDSDTPAEAFSVYELSEEDRKRGLFMMIYDQPPQFEMKEFFRPLATLEVQHGLDEADLLLSTLARAGNFAMEPLRVHAFFKKTPEGLKLDWEILAQTKYRTFQNFVELPETGQTGVFRVFIVEDVPDKNRAEAGTRTYRLADPANTGDTARVNVKVDSETGRVLSTLNWRGTGEGRPMTRTATVELSWTGDENAPQLEISRFICWEFLGLGGKADDASVSAK